MTVLTQQKRLRFFWIVFIAIFCWEWFPEYIAPTLTGVSIFCLTNRNSPWVTRTFLQIFIRSIISEPGLTSSTGIFGGSNGNEGLGMFALSFDWNYVGSGGGSLGALYVHPPSPVSEPH